MMKRFVKFIRVKLIFDSNITITTWQSFAKDPKDVMESFDVVIGDEAHSSKHKH